MTVISVDKNVDDRTMTMVAQFDSPPARVWQVWADPRQLERWWGPPTYPATVTDHELAPGGTVAYYMTSPDGEKYNGWWRITAVDAPRHLAFEDGFADQTGAPNPDMPATTIRVTLAEQDAGGTSMTIESTFPTREAMDQLTAMGMEEGMRASLGQIDELLAAAA